MAPILSNQWIAKRRPHWDRLAFLLTRSDQNGLSELSRAELQEMALLVSAGGGGPLGAAPG